jgi:hypothetical protein
LPPLPTLRNRLTLLVYSFVHDLVMDECTIRLDRHGANVHIPVISKGATEMTPLQVLRHHVTGAIERGEAKAIMGKPATFADQVATWSSAKVTAFVRDETNPLWQRRIGSDELTARVVEDCGSDPDAD